MFVWNIADLDWTQPNERCWRRITTPDCSP